MDKAIETLEQTLKKAKEIGFFEKISQIPDFEKKFKEIC